MHDFQVLSFILKVHLGKTPKKLDVQFWPHDRFHKIMHDISMLTMKMPLMSLKR
jgi:hypothetical protein